MAVKFVNVAIACNVSNIQGIIGEKKTTYLPGGLNYTIVLSQYFYLSNIGTFTLTMGRNLRRAP